MHPAIMEIARINAIKTMNPIPSETPRGVQTKQFFMQSPSDMNDLEDLKKVVKVRNVIPNLDDMTILIAYTYKN